MEHDDGAPDPADEALAALVSAGVFVILAGLSWAACFYLPPPKAFSQDGSLSFVLRSLLFLVLTTISAAAVALLRRATRRSARHRSPPASASTLRVAARAAAGDCPYCHAAIATGDLGEGVVRCPGCELAHHVECWREHAGCSTLGCRRDPGQRDALRAQVPRE